MGGGAGTHRDCMIHTHTHTHTHMHLEIIKEEQEHKEIVHGQGLLFCFGLVYGDELPVHGQFSLGLGTQRKCPRTNGSCFESV